MLEYSCDLEFHHCSTNSQCATRVSVVKLDLPQKIHRCLGNSDEDLVATERGEQGHVQAENKA